MKGGGGGGGIKGRQESKGGDIFVPVCVQQVLKALEALLLLLITEETALSLSCYKLRAPLSLRNTSAFFRSCPLYLCVLITVKSSCS